MQPNTRRPQLLRRSFWIAGAALASVTVVSGAGPRFDGLFESGGPEVKMTVQLAQGEDGTVAGVMLADGVQMQIKGSPGDPGVVGTLVGSYGDSYGFRAWFEVGDDALHFSVYPVDIYGRGQPDAGELIVLTRRGRAISVNRVVMTSEQLAKIENSYQFTLPEGRYWYDQACGAWGGM
ncbi:MAG: hypothetical protein OEV00_07885 [Acidobacteriota bacterium]|nr:hypothetical protein [Acidobacteriota bacterium]MDH3785233.1 hypothetical protein [Acidobacteriota bacterium]